jgi:hypothetical protein
MVGWGVRGLCRQRCRQRLGRYVDFPVIRLECVCTMGRGAPRDAIAWDKRTRVALYDCLVR